MARNKKRQQIKANWLILISSFWMSFIKCFPLPGAFVNGSIAFIGIVCLLYYLFYGNQGKKQQVVLFNLALSFCMFVSILYNGNAGFDNILWIWAYSGVAMLIVEYGVSKLTGRIAFWGSVLIVFLFIYSGRRPEEFYLFGSANVINAIVLFAYFIYIISLINEDDAPRLNVLPPFIFLVVSIWSSSRSGLVVAAFLLVGIFLLNTTTRNKRNRIVGIITIVAVFALFFAFFDKIYSVIGEDMTKKAERYGTGSIRTAIWSEYIDVAFSNFGDFFLGVGHDDPIKTPLLSFFSGNTHNSFLMLHSKYGLFGFLLVIITLIKRIFENFRHKQRYELFILFAVIIRAFFDWIAFPGIHDIVFFWFIFKYSNLYSNPQKTIMIKK